MTDWRSILSAYDRTVLLMFAGVCSFAMNWYVFEKCERVQRVMAVVAVLSSLVVVVAEAVT